MMGTQVSGKTLGLIGMGRIARAVAKRAHHGFGMRVLFHDPVSPPPRMWPALGAEPRGTLEEVLDRDATSCRCIVPAMPDTRHLMNSERLALMKPERLPDQYGAG